MDRPAILVTSSTFPRWEGDTGPARFVFDLCLHLTPFFHVIVLAPHAHGARRHEYIKDIEIFRFPYFWPYRSQALCNGMGILASLQTGWLPKLQAPSLFLSELYNLYRIIRQKRIVAINSHWMIPQGWNTALLKQWFPIPHLLTVHSADIHTLQRLPGGRSACRFIAQRSDLILPVSAYLHRLIEKVSGRAISAKVVPMGVDTRKFSISFDRQALRNAYKITSKYVLLFVGRLIEVKGVSVLLQAMSKLRRRIDILLLIAGSGSLQESLKAKAQILQLDEHVRFLGAVEHDLLPELYHLSDVVVIPSIVTHQQTEGTPVVLLEALAAGRPVVGSNVGGIVDVIQDQYNGRLIPPDDSEKLAAAIVTALAPENWSIWSANARQTGQKYDWAIIADQYREGIESIST